MLAYGLVATIGLQLATKKSTFETGKTDGEIILVGVTTSMAVASTYFLYILRTEFNGELCLYCLTSAALSFSLFFVTLKVFPWLDVYSNLDHLLLIPIVITRKFLVSTCRDLD